MTDPPKRSEMLQAALVVEGGLAALAVALAWVFRLDPGPSAQIHLVPRDLGLAFLATVPMILALLIMERWPIGPLRKIRDVMQVMLATMFARCTWRELLAVSALAGVGEELFFRGFAQRVIESYSGSPWLALSVASLLFGLAHPITKFYVVLAAAIGVYLGWLLIATDNLLVPIVVHAAYDFWALVYLLRRIPAVPPEASEVELLEK